MQRDMELVRAILLGVEANPAPAFSAGELGLTDWDKDTVNRHAGLMVDAGLLDGELSPYCSGGCDCWIRGLTWAGHDFLDTVRDDNIWSKTKSTVVQTAGTVSLEVLKAVATSIARSSLGLPPA